MKNHPVKIHQKNKQTHNGPPREEIARWIEGDCAPPQSRRGREEGRLDRSLEKCEIGEYLISFYSFFFFLFILFFLFSHFIVNFFQIFFLYFPRWAFERRFLAGLWALRVCTWSDSIWRWAWSYRIEAEQTMAGLADAVPVDAHRIGDDGVRTHSSSLFIESRKQWNRRWRSMGIGRVESLSGSHFIGSRTESNRRWGSSVVVWVEQSSVSLRWIISAMRELECWPTRCFPSLFIGSLEGWGRFLIALTTWTEGKRKWKKERK